MKMDKNTVIGLLLIVVILIGFSFYNKKQTNTAYDTQLVIADSLYKAGNYAEAQGAYAKALNIKADEAYPRERIAEISKRLADSAPVASDSAVSDTSSALAPDSLASEDLTLASDSLQEQSLNRKFGVFAHAATGNETFYSIENDLIKIVFSNKGGRPYSAVLKEYARFDSSQVVLLDSAETAFSLSFFANNIPINTQELFFETSVARPEIVINKGADSLSFRLKTAEGQSIEYVYWLEPRSYVLGIRINLNNMNQLLGENTSYLDFRWEMDMVGQEKGKKWEDDNSTIYYKHFEGDVEKLSERSDNEGENVKTRLKWVAFKQHFFSTVLIADDAFLNAEVRYDKEGIEEDELKHCVADLRLPAEGGAKQQIAMRLFMGPNQHKLLRKISKEEDLQLQELVFLGRNIIRWVNRYLIIPLFNFLGSFIGSYGLIILLMTIIIKIILFPLTYKSYISSARMRVLKPQIEQINAKIPKEKAMERQQAAMELYKKAGVNPLGGCLPMLLQMPILLAMFRFFPSSIELRQESFLWASDLSTYDSILNLPFTIPMYGSHVSLFTLLMAVAMVISTKMTSTQTDTGNQVPGMKMMMYLMPVMMVLWFNSYSAGLSYYYLLSNIITIGQTLVIRRFVDDDELLRKIEQNKKKPAPSKSKWQQRLEEAAKQRNTPAKGKKR